MHRGILIIIKFNKYGGYTLNLTVPCFRSRPCIAGVAEEIPATESSRCGGGEVRSAFPAIQLAAMYCYAMNTKLN